MSGNRKDSSGIFLITSGIIFIVLTVIIFGLVAFFLIIEFIGPGIGVPWNLTLWEALIATIVLFSLEAVGLLLHVPLWTLFVRPFVPTKEIRLSLTVIDPAFSFYFMTWYCTKIADWLVPEERQIDKTEGRDQLLSDGEKKIVAEMLMIKKNIELKYEVELSNANWFQKIFIKSRMHSEIKERVDERLMQRFDSRQSTKPK